MSAYRLIGRCPVCGDRMQVKRLQCERCHSALEGSFAPCRLCQLTQEQQEFVEVFLVNRGNIKDVERALGISYPTVRNRLEAVIEALGYKVERTSAVPNRREVLAALESGEITAQEAIQRLKGQ